MNRKPRTSAVDIATDKIKMLIQAGEIKKILPGERMLSQILSTGRETIRASLARLEKEGWISAPQGKRVRGVLEVKVENIKKYSRECVCFLTSTPHHSLPQSIWAEIYQLEQALRLEDMNLEVIEAPWLDGETPQKHLERLVAGKDCKVWILHRSSESSQKWFKTRGIPCIIKGMAYPSTPLPYIDTHWWATARHAAGYLYQRGHKCVGLCVPETQLWGNHLIKEGFLSFKADGWTPVVISTKIDTPDIHKSLDEAIEQHPKMTALILTRSRMVITLQSWVASRRMVVPDDLSLICLIYEHFMGYAFPPLASYQQNTGKQARRLIRMIFNLLKGNNIRNSLIVPELHTGQSIKNLARDI